jgi:hypothetical protein
MEEETLIAKIVHFAVFIAICLAIIIVGWREPLSYRFMSSEEIMDLTGPKPEPPRPKFVPRPSRLDERPARGTH